MVPGLVMVPSICLAIDAEEQSDLPCSHCVTSIDTQELYYLTSNCHLPMWKMWNDTPADITLCKSMFTLKKNVQSFTFATLSIWLMLLF